MRQLICEKIRVLWLHLMLLITLARIYHDRIKTTSQSQEEYLTVSFNHCSSTRCRQLPSSTPPCMLSLGQAPYLQWVDAMADKQAPNNQAMRKLPITPLLTTAYTQPNTINVTKHRNALQILKIQANICTIYFCISEKSCCFLWHHRELSEV